MRTIRIGLTGPIGCGKSTVAGWLAERGAAVIDADAVARAVTAPGTPGHDAILDRFGPAVAGPDGTLDRAALAQVVFGDPDRLAELEAIVHPAVRPQILARIDDAERSGAPIVAVEAIRLVEGGLAALCDEVWLVTCDPAEQRARAIARGGSAEDVDRRIAAQRAQRGGTNGPAATASRRIDTSGPPELTRARVLEALAGFGLRETSSER